MRMNESPHITDHKLVYHHEIHGASDRIAYSLVRFARIFADLFFRERYGHRAVTLETVAAIPGMVGGLWQHLKALRYIRDDHGWIKTLLDEAENERIHLLVYAHIAKPNLIERLLIVVVQVIFYWFYFFVYLFSPRTAHRTVGYLEEEAIHSYTEYLAQVDANPRKNVAAPEIAINYWKLAPDARLREVIIATRSDEVNHRDVNHTFADKLR